MRPERDAQLRDQVVRLVGVLRDLAPPTHAPVRHVGAHDAVLWLDDLRGHAVIGATTEVLRLRRAAAEPEPPAPPAVAGWVGPGGPDSEPVLHDRGPLHGQHAYLVDAPGVRDAFDAWMAAWRPWAHRERARRAQDELAAGLGELARLAADPSRELVLGVGLLHLPDESVQVHVVGQPVRITTDPATGDVVCTASGPPRPEDGGPRAGRPWAALRERLRELAPTALAPVVADVLAEWAGAGAPCAIEAGWTRPVGPSPVLAVAPALIVRRVGTTALHRCYDEIERSLRDETRPVPPGLAQLVRAVPPVRIPPVAFADDPLLPLPATEEQTRVVTALAAGTGVVVEGPPGTGKTHTLANLLGALLAAGQRVLVTSGDAGSLRVLRDRLPAGMQDLCVGLDDPEEGSGVARVAGERTEFDPVRADRRIADLAARRADAARTRDDLLHRVALLREAEARVYPDIAPGFGGTPAQIAGALLRSAPRDAWVPGPVRGQAPVSGPEFVELVGLLGEQTPRHRERRGRVPVAAPLAVEALARIAEAIDRGPQLRPGADDELVTALGDLLPLDALAALEGLAGEVIESVAALWSSPDPDRWAPATADRLLAEGTSRTWLGALAELDAVDVAIDHDQHAGGSRIEIAEGTDEFAAAQVFEHLAGYLDDGAALKRVFKKGEQRAAERLGQAVLVDGAPPRTRATALAAVHHLAVRRIAGRLDDRFAPLGTGIPYGPHAVESMLDLRAACAAVERVVAAAGAVGRVLVELPPQARPPLGSAADLERVARLSVVARAARAARGAHRELDAAVAVLESVPPARRGPEQTPVFDALRGLDVPAYTAALHALDVARQEHTAQLRADELLDRIRAAAPALADRLVEGLAVDPQRWDRAWARARAATWMDQQPAADAGARLDAELAVATGVVQSLTTELAVALAWRACLLRIDSTQAHALQAYRHAATQARAGTGEGAERLRSSARDAMAVALSAVPAWVLPVPALLETIAHRPGTFDVVIVDEATRLDPSCAFLLWLAPRIVVVGDDGQCPPPAVLSADPAAAALPDVPGYLRAALGPDGNLFSLLRTRIDTVVRLREHFRGVPEIAAWSASPREAPPVPLRRSGADGVPPLRSTHVPGRGQVRVLADTVAACAADPAYAGRTFGVVVPGGRSHVEAVIEALAERLDPAQWAARRLRVGSPQDLRGDERDVVWLPVSGAGPTLHGRAAVQDYELAVSRARDQLWIVHSVRPDQLAPGDVRRSLLEHVMATGPVLGPVPAGVRRDRRDERFDSLFEQAVFLDLAERGFHVVPQVTCNRRRIDLVVTGAGGTLAVECDGEAFRTTPEQRAADLAREQELMGCGWAFVRVRESVYLLDPAAALAPVWVALAERGIEPLGDLVDGEWTARVGVTEALPVIDAVSEDAVETAVIPAPAASVVEPPTAAVPVARSGAGLALVGAGPADSGGGFDAARAMVRPRGFGTGSAARRRGPVGGRAGGAGSGPVSGTDSGSTGSGPAPLTGPAPELVAGAGAGSGPDAEPVAGSGPVEPAAGSTAARSVAGSGSAAAAVASGSIPAAAGSATVAVPTVALGTTTGDGAETVAPPVGPTTGVQPSADPPPSGRDAEPVTPAAWPQVAAPPAARRAPAPPAPTGHGAVPEEPEFAVWMPGPRISADVGNRRAEPTSTGRHALREPADDTDPPRTPAPLFEAPLAGVSGAGPGTADDSPADSTGVGSDRSEQVGPAPEVVPDVTSRAASVHDETDVGDPPDCGPLVSDPVIDAAAPGGSASLDEIFRDDVVVAEPAVIPRFVPDPATSGAALFTPAEQRPSRPPGATAARFDDTPARRSPVLPPVPAGMTVSDPAPAGDRGADSPDGAFADAPTADAPTDGAPVAGAPLVDPPIDGGAIDRAPAAGAPVVDPPIDGAAAERAPSHAAAGGASTNSPAAAGPPCTDPLVAEEPTAVDPRPIEPQVGAGSDGVGVGEGAPADAGSDGPVLGVRPPAGAPAGDVVPAGQESPDPGPPAADLSSARHRTATEVDPWSWAPRAAPPATDPQHRATLLDVARHRPLTAAAVRNLLGVEADVARDLLADLTDEGVLVRRGQGRTTHWVPAEGEPTDLPRRLSDLPREGRPRLSSAG